MMRVSTDVFVVGAGGAGMYAAISAARAGADVILSDKSLISRGGATIMAQMTVASAVGHEEPDHWTHHLADTIEAGHGLCNEELSAILCEESVDRILEMDEWKVGWARVDGRMTQVHAPGHGLKRCVYVDYLNTGPAVARALRGEVAQRDGIRRASGLAVLEIVVQDGEAIGAVAVDVESGETVLVEAGAVVLAAGGLTKLYKRNSASINMGGESYAMALRAGAELIDMEFVQFFPIGHLAPRMVGMDPIMWDPFRYKVGGKLLNGEFEEFIHNYGATDGGTYTARRDLASYAIYKEVEEGRGSPHGGVWLSFEHIAEDVMKEKFGPMIKRLAKNGIDLQKQAVEVSPIAHYHMGGIRVNTEMETRVPGLFAAGEAVGGANGATRLSGNAIPEAFVFGERAGKFGAAYAKNRKRVSIDDQTASSVLSEPKAQLKKGAEPDGSATALMAELQELMWDKVGLFRTSEKLEQALERIREMQNDDLRNITIPDDEPFNQALLDWYELRAGLLCAESVTLAAINRKESRGAHQREDITDASPDLEINQTVELDGSDIITGWAEVPRISFALEEKQAAEI
ncbi:MAG: succinate dehydrogenase [Rhodospirillaceae bacterium]|nr:succinate dehydrogenase [Rhodospirillaceae bacterium]|tara:strand:+ start:1985 stop:3706 length:1722 start_codon:yes stop_codon:yes gene_type:complete